MGTVISSSVLYSLAAVPLAIFATSLSYASDSIAAYNIASFDATSATGIYAGFALCRLACTARASRVAASGAR
jgi:predicted secreted protein